MDFFWLPDDRFLAVFKSRNYGDYYYRDRATYYGPENYRDPYYPRDRNWYYQPEYRNPYDR